MTKEQQPVTAIIDALRALPTANIADSMERFGCPRGILPVWDGARVAAEAFTVLTRAGDNLFLHEAMKEIAPGQVMVVDGGGDESRALMGDLIGARALDAGVAGFVIDGAVRDAPALRDLGLPVFARTVTPAGPYKHGPGRLQVPVAIGGVVVRPGDIVVGDEDGVVVVPIELAEEVAVRARGVFDGEIAKRAAMGR